MRWLILALLIITIPNIAWADDPVIFTSTRYVMDLAFSPDGTLWVATRGGVLSRDTHGTWQKLTVADGLPFNESRKITTYPDSGSILVDFTNISAAYSEGKWTLKQIAPAKSEIINNTPPPSSTGSHISGRCKIGNREIAAVFGDGLYEYTSGKWTRMNINLPEKAREITTLTSLSSTLWLGTRREGVWEYNGKIWTQHLQLNEPYDHNIQCIAVYQGNILSSTLEDGLVVRTLKQWRHILPPEISSNAPRQMVEFGRSLYLRHGNGKVDRLDGNKWALNICASLPRKQASCISADQAHIYIGQWGGWSEFDGKAWEHHLQIPELQGFQITAILPEHDRIWVGTQGRGLAEINRQASEVKWHDERNGLPDDWVKCLTKVGDLIYAGTFVGGLAYLGESGWVAYPELANQEITALLSCGQGRLAAATRSELYSIYKPGEVKSLSQEYKFPLTEIQALCMFNNELWVGTRTGLVRAD